MHPVSHHLHSHSPETMVTGPFPSVRLCRVKFFTRSLISVDFPTLGGPTTATHTGGGSTGVRSTTGTRCRLAAMSSFLLPARAARTADLKVNAFGLLVSSFSLLFLAFFSALGPAARLRCVLAFAGSSIALPVTARSTVRDTAAQQDSPRGRWALIRVNAPPLLEWTASCPILTKKADC